MPEDDVVMFPTPRGVNATCNLGGYRNASDQHSNLHPPTDVISQHEMCRQTDGPSHSTSSFPPHGGLRLFHQKSSCLDEINFRATLGHDIPWKTTT